jgi:O-antigen/teichoic acid export membrane protein
VALVSRELVLAVLGEKWRAVPLPLTLLVLYAGVRSLTPILSQALTITGDTRYTMHRNIAGAICLPIGFVIGARWGIVGIATAWIIVHAPVVLIPQLHRVSSHLGIGVRAYVPAIAPAFVSTVIMAGAVALAGVALPRGTPMAAVLAVKVAVGVAVYAGSVWFLFRDHVLAIARAVAQARGQAPAAAAPGPNEPVAAAQG